MRRLLLAALLSCATSSAFAKAHIVKSIPGSDGIWDYASYDGETNRVFIAHGATVDFVDVANPASVQTLGPSHHAHQVLPLPGRHEVLVTEGDTGTARILNSKTGELRATIALGSKPDAAIWDGRRHRAVVMNNKGGTISIVDVQAAKVTSTITLAPGLEYATFDPKGLLYVNNEKTNDLTVVDLDRGQAVAKIALDGCEGPTGIAWAPKAKRIVSSCDGVATLFDPATRKVTGKITIGAGPDAVIPDLGHDRLYIPSGDTGTMTVLSDSPSGVKLVETVATVKGARTGAVDPHTDLIYLPVADFLPAAGGAKPEQKPGSFRVLVVSPR